MKLMITSKRTIILIGIWILLIFFFLYVLATKESGTWEDIPQANSAQSLEEMYLRYALSEDIIQYANIEAPSIANIWTGTDEFGNYLTLKLIPNQPLKNNGIRAEISIDSPYQEGDTLEYRWDFKIPNDFVSDAPNNRWWVLADWHVQPDVTKGETWDNYIGKSSPIILWYGNIDWKDALSLSTWIHWSKIGIIPRGILTFTRDVWHTLKVVIKWSQSDDGEVMVYFDDSTEPMLSAKWPNMINWYQHYLKVGQYRDREISTENSISIKNISIKK